MFEQDTDGRLSAWSGVRKQIDSSKDPLQVVIDFWSDVPFTPHNHIIDPYYQDSWPTPWELIVHNRYDDFTKAVMIGYTLLLTEKYRKSAIQIKTLVDISNTKLYNVVCVDNLWALNFSDTSAVAMDIIPSSFRLENLIDLVRPR